MTSLPPPPSPAETSAAAASSGGNPHSNSNDNNMFGPVTKLAHIAAVQEERDRIEKRRVAQYNLQAAANLVGETALAIAKATASGAPGQIRLSPNQQQSLSKKALLLDPNELTAAANASDTILRMSPMRATPPKLPQMRKMSVAARARAAADLPRMPGTGTYDDNDNNNDNNKKSSIRPAPRPGPGPQQRAPSSGSSAGVSRGEHSKAQVKQMADDKSDVEDESNYYNGTSDGSASGDGEMARTTSHENFKQSLQQAHHHLQYTMSNSPGAENSPSAAESAAEEAFRYQHHRVSAYNNYGSGGSRRSSPRPGEEEEEGGGIFASAKNWLQSQRERLHHLELERQVEDQRRKLVEEGRRQRAMEAERRRKPGSSPVRNRVDRNTNSTSNSLAGNDIKHHRNEGAAQSPYDDEVPSSGSFGCISPDIGPGMMMVPGEEDLCDIHEQTAVVSGMPNLCGFGGVYANPSDDNSADYEGMARIDSRGNILEMISGGSLDESDFEGGLKVLMKVSSPKCTLSGNGMSVKVDIPSDNEEEEEENDIDVDDNYDDDDGNHVTSEEEDDIFFVSDIKIVEEPHEDDIAGSMPILKPSQMKALLSSGGLPPSVNFCRWKRLYSLTRDGDSFDQFLRLVARHDRTVLAVKTTHGQLFGGYADTRWEAKHVRQHAFEFYGSAQACLYKFPNHGTGSREDKIAIYKWTGANRYIQLCDAARRTLAFGGGGNEGEFGLCIEDDFRRGTTGHCSTFENEALCEEGFFDVMDLEVWGFTLDF